MSHNIVHISKFLSLILRHQPQTIGLELDSNGWAGLDELIAKARSHGERLDEALILEVVASSDKQRFVVDPLARRIRANQGHSVNIDIGLPPRTPPHELWHGTATRFVAQIRREGLRPMNRQHVHLSHEQATAVNVATRHGVPIVLRIHAAELAATGHLFYLSDNGVWLSGPIAPEHIDFAD